MSLTSYRAAPPRVEVLCVDWWLCCAFRCLQAWQRPTLPRLETKYHWRWGFSRPSSGWDRVFGPPPWPPGRRASERRIPDGSLEPVLEVGPAPWEEGGLSATGAGEGQPCLAGVVEAYFNGSEEPIWVPTSTPKGEGRECEPIERLVPVSCTRCRASTSGLST
jgi:hypothetical protein